MPSQPDEKSFLLTMRGSSMEPHILPGDNVLALPVSPKELCREDLAVWGNAENCVVHWICAKAEFGEHVIFLQAPQAGKPLTLLRSEQIIGKAVSIIRDGKQIEFAEDHCPIENSRLRNFRLKLYLLWFVLKKKTGVASLPLPLSLRKKLSRLLFGG